MDDEEEFNKGRSGEDGSSSYNANEEFNIVELRPDIFRWNESPHQIKSLRTIFNPPSLRLFLVREFLIFKKKKNFPSSSPSLLVANHLRNPQRSDLIAVPRQFGTKPPAVTAPITCAGQRRRLFRLLRMGELATDKHVRFILTIEKNKDSLESVVMEHLRMNGAYWGLTALDILNKLNVVDQDEVISWIMDCQHESGGFGGNIGHDPHILYTLSAVQVLALFDKINTLDIDKVSSYIAGLQNEDGSFSGDMWGEVDTRFSYIAICCLSLLHQLDKMDVEKAVNYIVSCKNLDGGFGSTPGGESHAGQTVSLVVKEGGLMKEYMKREILQIPLGEILAQSGFLRDLLGWWLCERQVKSGGLNGRPEKLPDVCYSWWVLSSLIMIDRVHWIDKEKLVKFILDCQDTEKGGISDRPDDAVDVFHTYFGVAGLSLLEYPGIKAIDPAYALPVDVVNRVLIQR